MKRIKPGGIRGRIKAPPSKSLTQRAIFLAALADGESTILLPSDCDDAESAARVARGLGAEISQEGDILIVYGSARKANGGELACGESGFCARSAIPLAAAFKGTFLVTGERTLATRPIGPVEAPMKSLGARCRTTSGFLPASVTGPMTGGEADVDGSPGSQFLSGLLMALPVCRKDSELSVSNLKSKPYVRMTMQMAGRFGAKVSCDKELTTFAVDGGQALKPASVKIEGDWSGAAFILAAGALAGSATVAGLDLKSLQPDRAILGALKDAGAKVKAIRGSLDVEGAPLEGFGFDASDCPDLFPPLVVLAAGCKGTSVISGAGRLRAKESDRAAALYRQFKALGADVSVKGDTIVIRGCQLDAVGSKRFCLSGGTADPRGDHRVAMACAVAGLVSEKGVSVKNPECVSKSYPGFFGDLARLAVRR